MFFRPYKLRAGASRRQLGPVLRALDVLWRLWPVSVLLILAHTLGMEWLDAHPWLKAILWAIQAWHMLTWYQKQPRDRPHRRKPWHTPAHSER